LNFLRPKAVFRKTCPLKSGDRKLTVKEKVRPQFLSLRHLVQRRVSPCDFVGSKPFADVETGDTHVATFTPQGSNYLGTFSLDPVTETGGTGSVGWHYTVNNADIQFLAQGQSLTQVYSVAITDEHGATGFQNVSVTLNGTNDTPTAVDENVITDVGPNGTVDIQPWMLAANDTDPDTTDHLFVNSVGPGSAAPRHRSATSSSSTTRRRGDRSPTRPRMELRPAATPRPRPSSTMPHQPPRLPVPAVTISSSPPTAPRRSTAAAATTS
jgi:VCBS repeat-containing protein